MDNPLAETSMREQARVQKYADRAKRIAQEKPESVSAVLARGGEGRMFHSYRGANTEPTNAFGIDATVVETGRGAAVHYAEQEAAAIARQPLPRYAEPTDELDPRAHPNVDDLYASDPKFRAWLENDAPPEKVAKIGQIALEQRENKRQLAELSRLVPNWQEVIEPLIAWLRATQGTTDQDIRQFMRNPDARLFAQWFERFKRAQYEGAAAKAKRTGHLEDVGRQLESLIEDTPEAAARQRPADKQALLAGLKGEIDSRLPGGHVPGETSESVVRAGAYFAELLGGDESAEVESAEDRSVL